MKSEIIDLFMVKFSSNRFHQNGFIRSQIVSCMQILQTDRQMDGENLHTVGRRKPMETASCSIVLSGRRG